MEVKTELLMIALIVTRTTVIRYSSLAYFERSWPCAQVVTLMERRHLSRRSFASPALHPDVTRHALPFRIILIIPSHVRRLH